MARAANDPFALPTARGRSLELPPRIPHRGEDEIADRRWLSGTSRPWALDLFCGAGGLSLGLERAGFSVIAAADSDARAVQTHAANFEGMAWCLDLSRPDALLDRLARRGVTSVDLVAGGPPCQPFSRAGAAKLRSLVSSGARSSDDARVNLWTAFLALIDALNPSVVLLENVPDMARWADGEIVLALISGLRARGFDPDARVLNAWEHGVPQHRARLFLTATKRGRIAWPRARARMTLREAVGDLPEVPAAQRDNEIPYVGPPTTPFQRRARTGLPRDARHSVFDHCTRDVRTDDAEAFSLLAEGQTYADLPDRLKRYRSDIFDDKYKRLEWDDVSRTITAHIAKDGYWYIHPEQDRTLSIREAARVQTFPDRFRFAGHPTTQLRQIGNAVPPALAEAVGKQVMAALNGRPNGSTPPVHDLLRSWRYPEESIEPWLLGKDPWKVLVGEMTLRRCPAAHASDVLAKLLDDAPSAVETERAAARPQGAPRFLSKARWQRLASAARELTERFDGRIPSDEASLLHVPGIGVTVASAVRCFAFDKPAVLLDAGTRRVVARVSGRNSSSAWVTRLEVYRWAGHEGPDRSFNLALRALAATHCTPRKPTCARCPLIEACASAEQAGSSGSRRTPRPGLT